MKITRTAIVATDLQIGHADGDAGRFWCIQDALVTVGGMYTQTATGTIEYWFPGYLETEPLITAGNMAIGGTLSTISAGWLIELYGATAPARVGGFGVLLLALALKKVT